MTQGRMTDPKGILAYMTAGKAKHGPTITFRNAESGNRFTYKIKTAPKRQPNDPDTWFVQLLNGPDNTSDFMYIGILRKDSGVPQYMWTSKARADRDASSVQVFQWALNQFVADKIPASLEVYHEGRCGRCGRKLTVPESIASGFGPECIGLTGMPQVELPLIAGKAAEQENGLHFPAESYLPAQGTVVVKVPVKRTKPTGKVNGSAAPVSLNVKIAKVAEYKHMSAQIEAKVAEYKATAPENYYQDGELTETEAHKVAFNKFRLELVQGVR